MQKIINVLAVLSFIVSATSIAGASYVYINIDEIVENVKEKAVKEITNALPTIVEELIPDIPEIPNVTGDVIDLIETPTMTGLPIN